VIDILRRDSAGRSAERRFAVLYMEWKRRRFGRRVPFLLRMLFVLLLILTIELHPSRTWSLYIGMFFGATYVGWMMLPQIFMPRQIFYWQMGAWGEQKTASELKRLKKQGWVVRNDAAWGEHGNHDHVVAGPAVFLINSKNTPDSSVTVEGEALRVTSIDVPADGYLADKWIPAVRREALSLKRRLDREVGFPVAVYPVLALWADFPAGQTHIGDVCVVDGMKLVDWVGSRKPDLMRPEKRQAVEKWVRDLPSARTGDKVTLLTRLFAP
jgi:Nuclease-related domain